MNIRANLASVIIPNSQKAKTIFRLFISNIFITYDTLLSEFDTVKANELMKIISEDLGKEAANLLKNETKMENGYSSAILSWKIGCKLLRFSIHTQKTKDGTYFYHDKDPLWEKFKLKNIDLCYCVCLPMVTAIAKSFCSDCEVELSRKPTLESPCIKILKKK